MNYGYGNGGLGPVGGQAVGYDTMSTAPPPSRVPAVTAQLEQALKQSEALHNVIEQLEGRLSVVLQPTGPSTPASGEKLTVGEMVPMAQGLSEINRRLSGASARLRSLLDRIEL